MFNISILAVVFSYKQYRFITNDKLQKQTKKTTQNKTINYKHSKTKNKMYVGHMEML